MKQAGIVMGALLLAGCAQVQGVRDRMGDALGGNALERCTAEATEELAQIDASIAEVEGRIGTGAAQSDDEERLVQLQALRERRAQSAEAAVQACQVRHGAG